MKPGWMYPPSHKTGTYLVVSPGFERVVAERIRNGNIVSVLSHLQPEAPE